MDHQHTTVSGPIKALSGPNSPANAIRHQKSVSDSAALDISMLSLSSGGSSGPGSPLARPNPKRLSTHSDSSVRTTLSGSTLPDTDDSSSYKAEPTPTRTNATSKPVTPLLSRHRPPTRTFSSPVPTVDQESLRYHPTGATAYDLGPAQWQLTDAMMRAQISGRAATLPPLQPWLSTLPKFEDPSAYTASPVGQPIEASLAAWQAHQLGLQQQLLQQYTLLQQQQQQVQAGLRSHSRSASYQSTQSTDSSGSFGAMPRMPSMLEAYTAAAVNPFLGQAAARSSLIARARLAQVQQPPAQASPEQEIEAAEQELAREAAAYNTRKTATNNAFPGLLDAQSLQQAAITMAYTGQSYPMLSLYGITPEISASQPGLTSAIARLVSLRANQNESAGPSPANKKTNLYKTELCRSWEEKGSCRYGGKCQFAHGQDELKPVSRHPKFKTEICRTFWLHGSCPYGKRCCFLHTTTEAGSGPAGETSSNEPATSRLQQRTSGLATSHAAYIDTSAVSTPTTATGRYTSVSAVEAPGPRSRLERLRPVSSTTASHLLRSAPAQSHHSKQHSLSSVSLARYSPLLEDRPSSALSDRSSSLLTPFTGHRSAASSPTDSATLSASPQPFPIKGRAPSPATAMAA